MFIFYATFTSLIHMVEVIYFEFNSNSSYKMSFINTLSVLSCSDVYITKAKGNKICTLACIKYNTLSQGAFKYNTKVTLASLH